MSKKIRRRLDNVYLKKTQKILRGRLNDRRSTKV